MSDRNCLAKQKLQKKKSGCFIEGNTSCQIHNVVRKTKKKKKTQTSGILVWLLLFKQSTDQLKRL